VIERSRHRSRRLIGYLSLLLFIAAQVLAGLHHAMEQHEVCVEHGVLAHAGHAHGAAGAHHELHRSSSQELDRASAGGAPVDPAGPVAVGDERADHEDCRVPGLRDLRGAPGHVGWAGAISVQAGPRPADLVAQLEGPRHDLLRMAPKQSPPPQG